ncbi:MAG: 50S ribosomal protein L17 [Bacteroidia bacterium]|nr:50S ribosomal protein L17 [Bacteroidia bacterium]
MRHGVKINHLGRTASHRKAMLSNMASSLIKHKKITTTVAKAKALRVYVEPLITKAKSDSVHNRRTVFSYLRDKEAIKELYGVVASKIGDRQGGYTRILKLGNRMGDNAEMALIELVDFNEFIQPKPAKEKKKTTRRGRSATKAKQTEAVAADEPKVEETPTNEVVEESIVEDVADENNVEDSANDTEEANKQD